MVRQWLGVLVGLSVWVFSTPPAAVELEFPVHGGIVMPTERDDTLAAAGPIAGVTPLVLLTRPMAVGMLLEYSRLAWRAAGPEPVTDPFSSFPDDDGSMQTLFVGGVFRWYVVDVRPVYPYLQVALGYSDHQQLPDHPSCSVNTGFGMQVAAGGDFGFSPWGRLGVSAAAFPFSLGQACDEIGGGPPHPPFPGIGFALQINLTTVWRPVETQ